MCWIAEELEQNAKRFDRAVAMRMRFDGAQLGGLHTMMASGVIDDRGVPLLWASYQESIPKCRRREK